MLLVLLLVSYHRRLEAAANQHHYRLHAAPRQLSLQARCCCYSAAITAGYMLLLVSYHHRLDAAANQHHYRLHAARAAARQLTLLDGLD